MVRGCAKSIHSAAILIAFCAALAYGQGTARGDPSTQSESADAHRATDSASAAAFVQRFYNWYAPIALKERTVPAWWHVLDSARTFLEPALAAAIRGDSVAREQDIDTREMLDFDPFLESQDPCLKYEVSRVQPAGQGYRVTVRPFCASGQARVMEANRPAVELSPSQGGWRISTIWYVLPDSSRHDLKSMLCQWAKADRKPERRPAHC